jgi:putative Mg2+ transporter-C (MgtC) family protein
MSIPVGHWHDWLFFLLKLVVAYVLTAIIGWNREREEHTVGIRTFPIVGMASCGYLLLVSGTQDTAAASRVMQGLITGIGFIGGGAILKEGASVKGTATAASIWNAGVIGASIAMDRYDVGIALSLLNLVALRVLLPLKLWLDRTKQQ